MKRYAVIYSKSGNGWGAHAPDVPGCIATAPTREACERQFAEALEFHFEGLRLAGEPIPEPDSEVGTIELAA